MCIVTVEKMYSEVMTLGSRKPEVNISSLIVDKLALLQALNISGLNITDQSTDLIAVTLSIALSLELFDISCSNLGAEKCAKVLGALKHISTLQCLKMSTNTISDDDADCITAVIGNCKIEELDISNNELSSIGMIKVIDALSKANAIKILDISKNFVSVNNQNMSASLMNCFTLQEINLSHNSLVFTEVIRIARALSGHPNLKHLNIDKNLISFFSECEFLVDVILSTIQSLQYLNVCGRNIRPRFVADFLYPPPNSEESEDRFVLQNLFLSRYSSLDSFTFSENNLHVSYGNFIETDEKCPISCEDIVYYYVNHTGGTFHCKAHDFAIVIPPGAVSQGDCVQIQATASRFGPYQIPDGYYPISSFFWVSAHYTFKLPVYLIMSHYAYISSKKDINNVCVLQACVRDLKVTHDGKLVLEEVSGGTYCDNDINYCVFATDHFCSICLSKKDKHIANRFSAMYYTYDVQNFSDEYFAEVCFCPSTSHCKRVSLYIDYLYASEGLTVSFLIDKICTHKKITFYSQAWLNTLFKYLTYILLPSSKLNIFSRL